MTRSLKADGESWDMQLARDAPHPGVRAVVFRCTSNSSHGWRVVEVAESAFGDGAALDALDEGEVRTLFERSQPFDYTHDPDARPDGVGEGTGR